MPTSGLIPGNLPIGHGTMCAYDACIAAPECTLLDIDLLQSTVSGGFSGLLSDTVRAYRHLINVMIGVNRKSMVVNNSWGMFHPSQDFPIGHPGNYSHNPNHPFNRIAGDLERAGADILIVGQIAPMVAAKVLQRIAFTGQIAIQQFSQWRVLMLIKSGCTHPKALAV